MPTMVTIHRINGETATMDSIGAREACRRLQSVLMSMALAA